MPKTITDLKVEETLDSRGRPTLAVALSSGEVATRVAVPSGKSTGRREAVELRDADGVGVKQAIKLAHEVIKPALIGLEVDQTKIDQTLLELDGTPEKRRLGGNNLIGISMAVASLTAKLAGKPLWQSIAESGGWRPKLPKWYLNIINGGVHADFLLPFQEYMIILDGQSPRANYDQAHKIFDQLGEIIKARYGEVSLGDEGGYSPKLGSLEAPFELLVEVTKRESPEIKFAIDAAASEFLERGHYRVLGQDLKPRELLAHYEKLVKKFPLTSIEDPFAEDDLASFEEIVVKLGQGIDIVGDDLTTTNPAEIKKMIEHRGANAVIIKPNQIGTMTETYEAVKLAQAAGWGVIISHRSGDTPDAFIADLAVGVGADGIKAGSPNPPERRAKYERLIEIAEQEMV
ncbi:MAG: enolase C-terminal domain-like protein [Patescibacteria group bacterium]